jgi:hypothetical protein
VADDSWYFLDAQGARQGPVSHERLAELVRQGELGPETLVWIHPDPAWSPLRDRLPGLVAAPPAPFEATAGAETPPPRRGAWTDVSAHPWRRYFARSLDNMVVGTLTWVVIGAVLGVVNPSAAVWMSSLFRQPYGPILDGMATVFVVIPGNAVIIGLTGLSIGKWVFGVRVTNRAGRPIGIGLALAREVQIWITGLGLGVPLASFIALVMSYSRLQDRRATGWDAQQRNLVVHRPANAVQAIMSILGVAVIVAILIALRFPDLQQRLNQIK